MINSRFNKIVWTINGVGILILVLFGTFMTLKQIYRQIEPLFKPEFDQGLIVGSGAQKAIELNVDLQHIYYNSPTKILNSSYYFSEVIIMDKYIPPEIEEEMKKMNDMPRMDATVNIIFFKSDRTDVFTLLDKPGYIKMIDHPSGDGFYKSRYHYKTIETPENQKFILYDIATMDTNDDSRINFKDKSSYFISDLDGKNFIQITPDSLTFDSFWYLDECDEIYFEEILSEGEIEIGGIKKDLKKRNVYVYNLEEKKLEKFNDLEEIIGRMKSDIL